MKGCFLEGGLFEPCDALSNLCFVGDEFGGKSKVSKA